METYRIVAVGGTFDRLHLGHKDFLNFVLGLGKKVVLGLTSDLYIKTYKNGLGIEPYEVRLRVLEDYLKSTGRVEDVEIISLDDHFGPTLDHAYQFESLAVTTATEEAGRVVNQKRKEKNLAELPLEIFTLTPAEDGKPITSTRIRRGEINRVGRLYVKPEWMEKTLLLPSTLREKLQDVWGELTSEISHINSAKLITVGDMTTKTFIDKKIFPLLTIVDNKVERKDIPEEEYPQFEKIKVENLPGTISPELFLAVRDSINSGSQKMIVVNGEEDLAVLPVLLCAPLGYVIFYGQPGAGMAKLTVNEDDKNRAYELLSLFEKKDVDRI